MKTLIKLAVVVIVIYAVAQAGLTGLGYFQLKDATQQLITFGTALRTQELHELILEEARELEIPLAATAVTVERQGTQTTAAARYTVQYQYFPGRYYPVELAFVVESFALNPVF